MGNLLYLLIIIGAIYLIVDNLLNKALKTFKYDVKEIVRDTTLEVLKKHDSEKKCDNIEEQP